MTHRASVNRQYLPYLTCTAAVVTAAVSYLFLPTPKLAEAATPGTITYTYDSVGGIRGDANPTGNSGIYQYDNAGNRTSMTLN